MREALVHLIAEDRVRESDEGYRLQSPEQRDWEKTRRGIDMRSRDAVRLRKRILKDVLGSMTVSEVACPFAQLTCPQEAGRSP